MASEHADWNEYRKLVLATLERMEKDISDIRVKINGYKSEDISSMKRDITQLQIKTAVVSSIYGAGSGLLVAVAIGLMKYLAGR